jgi:hypothetical protein
MNRKIIHAVLALGFAGTAGAQPLEQAMKAQKNGMWEIRVGAQAAPMLFCVTDATKLDGLQQSRETAKKMGCKLEKESFQGGAYELAYACNHPSPEVGAFRMVMKGTARPDAQSGSTTVTGGGKLMQMMFPGGSQTAVESRWLRPCKPDEKPGPQGDVPRGFPGGGFPGMQGAPRQPAPLAPPARNAE